jgi:hypothetical protein
MRTSMRLLVHTTVSLSSVTPRKRKRDIEVHSHEDGLIMLMMPTLSVIITIDF